MASEIASLLFAEHEALDVLRAMRQGAMGGVDDRQPRLGKPGGDGVDRGSRIEARCYDKVVFLPREEGEARSVALPRGWRQHSPLDPQLPDGPLDPEVRPVAVRIVDACGLQNESHPEALVAHRTGPILSSPCP